MIAPPVEPCAKTEMEVSLLQNDGNRDGDGGPAVPVQPPRSVSELDPDRAATPASAYRLFTYFAMFWIVALFTTIALVLEFRWVHSPDWFAIPLPPVLRANALILLAGSVSVEFARRSLHAANTKRAARWTFVAASLGAAFLAGQIFAWQEFALALRHAASNPGSFFFYLITAAHAILVLASIAFLGNAGTFIRRPERQAGRQSAFGTVALYWHFVVGLWICLWGLLWIALQ